jgi:xylose isomerase
MVGLMGRQADRFHEYQPARGLRERLEMAGRVRGADGIEVVYPADFSDPDQSVQQIRECGLPVSAVNLNVKSAGKWQRGSFTSPDPALRAEATADLKTAMDLAVELEAHMVTCCPLIDGHNYSFQVDYLKQWEWLEAALAECGEYRTEVRISLEYKINESRNYCILGDVGRTLYLCERLGHPNLGITLDVGHALVAGETPAEAACLAHRAGRLFYVHFNDNAREWDWDMLPGSVNLWDLIETVFYLGRIGWDGWLAYDVLTRDGEPVEQMDATISIMKTAEKLVDKIGRERLEEFIAEGIAARAFSQLVRSLL